ncbi:MAG: hypothetical protein K2K21_13980 [Lachnospiraceae bacterium]|nr:hypothetical protein [Lachnospiraceae bacterium]
MNPYQFITDIKETSCTAAQCELQKTLIELNRHKEICHISVKELCNQAHVARSTFYSYYDNVIQLKEQIEDNLIYQLLRLNDDLNDVAIDLETGFPFFQNTCHFIEENKQAFYTFLVANPNVRFIQKWQAGIKYHFWNRFFDDVVRKNEKLILEIISSQAITAFTYWLKNPYDVDIDSLNLLIMRTLQLLI